MTTHPRNRDRIASGLTYLELSVVIGVLLSLASATFAGANAWKHGSNRASCIVTIRNVQQAVRCYQNIHNYNPGATPRVLNGSQSIARHLYDSDYIRQHTYDQILGTDPCPGGGSYSISKVNSFPLPGDLFVECSLADSQRHAPETGRDW